MPMRNVYYGGELLPRELFDMPGPPGSCPRCGGMGRVPESIDRELPDVMVPCDMCQMWCGRCKQWVAKKGHQCP